ncbi:MAG: rhomboid family intramembrane serine protease [Flammeovirgaceae bacterium]|nr:rhomboid family intramembrane serine protease [Flammeovirgaceae bacterium]
MLLSFSLIFMLSILAVSLFCLHRPTRQTALVFAKAHKEFYRFLSAALVHADILHLLANTFTFYWFADQVEHQLAIKWGSWGKWWFSLLFWGAIAMSNFLWKYNRFSTQNSFGCSAGTASIIATHILYSPTYQLCISFLCMPSFVAAILFCFYIYYERNRFHFIAQQWIVGTVFGVLLAFLLKPSSLWDFLITLFTGN